MSTDTKTVLSATTDALTASAAAAAAAVKASATLGEGCQAVTYRPPRQAGPGSDGQRGHPMMVPSLAGTA